MSMKKILIRNVPDELHRKLKVLAAEEGGTLNDICLTALSSLVGNVEETPVLLWKSNQPTLSEAIKEFSEKCFNGDEAVLLDGDFNLFSEETRSFSYAGCPDTFVVTEIGDPAVYSGEFRIFGPKQ